MKTILLSAALLFATTSPALAEDGHGAWVDDFDQAVTIAKEQGKDLFIDFTGSDWCGWCKKLNKEVFDHDAFLEPANKDFVLVALDFPRGDEAKANVPNPERNQELSETYGIRGFPTILLMNPDGDVLARMGYQKGGPEQYVEDMTASVKEGKRLLAELAELRLELDAADDKLPVLAKAVTLLTTMHSGSAGVGPVADMARQAMAKDADNSSGLKLRAMTALLNAEQHDDALLDDAGTMDPKNTAGLLESVVQARFGSVRDDDSARAAISALEQLLELEARHDTSMVATLTGQAALWCEHNLADHERALPLVAAALKQRDELPEQMIEMLDEIAG